MAVSAVLMAGCSGGAHLATGSTSTNRPPSTTTSAVAASTTSSPTPSTSATTLPPSALDTITVGDWTGVEPHIIYFSGDSGNIVSTITWSEWNASSAVGRGSWGYDDCVPDCAQGTTTPYPATITLSGPVDGRFTLLTETQSGPHGHTFTFTLPDRDLGGAA